MAAFSVLLPRANHTDLDKRTVRAVRRWQERRMQPRLPHPFRSVRVFSHGLLSDGEFHVQHVLLNAWLC